MPSVFELLFDTYGDHLMQEQAPLDLAALQAALDPLELDPDARLEICDLLTAGARPPSPSVCTWASR